MNELVDTSSPVRKGEELNAPALEKYLREHLPELAGPLSVEQFPGGSSNLTYLLRIGPSELVLRRPPFGNQVKSAHDMGREYRVLSKLHAVYQPAPRPLAYCDDEAVLGAPFYIMQRRHGVVLRRKLPPGLRLDPATARRLCESFVDNLVSLHHIDYELAGLGDLGKPIGYARRQLEGWTKRYEAARTEEVPGMHELIAWLTERLPVSGGAALVHNDYKFDNLLLDPHDLTKIIGVLDWEMCTLGDPLMDFGTTLSYWVEAADPPPLQTHAFGPTTLPGSMTRRELVDRYAQKTGCDVSNMLFYYCFGLFKVAVIIQQIYARYVRGHTQDQRFANLNRQVAVLTEHAQRSADAGSF